MLQGLQLQQQQMMMHFQKSFRNKKIKGLPGVGVDIDESLSDEENVGNLPTLPGARGSLYQEQLHQSMAQHPAAFSQRMEENMHKSLLMDSLGSENSVNVATIARILPHEEGADGQPTGLRARQLESGFHPQSCGSGSGEVGGGLQVDERGCQGCAEASFTAVADGEAGNPSGHCFHRSSLPGRNLGAGMENDGDLSTSVVGMVSNESGGGEKSARSKPHLR